MQISKQPLTIDLGELDLIKAGEMLRRGSPPDEIARAVFPAYDTLTELEKGAVLEALAQAPKTVPPGLPGVPSTGVTADVSIQRRESALAISV